MNKKTDQPSASLGQTLGKADFTQRPMSLRKFLEPFDHRSLTDAEAGEKYALYKASFAKQQLEDVFEKHKNSAWFREKYHPDVRFNPEINMKLCKRRLEIFMDLYSRVAVKLAGGNDEDVRFLDDFRYSDVKRKGSTNETSGMLESALMMGSGKTDVPETLAARNNTKTKKTAERSMVSEITQHRPSVAFTSINEQIHLQNHRPTGILVHRLGTLSTNDDSRIDHTSPENLRQNPCSLVKRHKLGDASAASTLNNRPHQPRVSDSDPMNSPVDTSFVHQRPVHHTSVLYFPHIPLNVYQKDLITLLSTSPHFIRLAVLDPCIMPASDNWRTNSETLFDPKGESSWLGIALRRVGWASFAAQIRNETNTLMEIDLDSIRAQLIEQASEAQAPDDLLNCLRLSRVIPYSMGLSPTDRIRSTGTVLSSLLNHCPSRVYSKGYLRRHLVLAARLTDELDKARSLWSSDDETCMGSAIPIDTENLAKSVGVHGGLISSEEVKFGGDHQGTQLTSVEGIIDPGEDLVSAAAILNAVISRNPLLAGLTDCLVDEGSAEEELLLSGGFQAVSSLPDAAVPAILRTTVPSTDNTEMLQILDRLILYLRIVHSVDFYAPAFYVNEDAMPHPCQLMHVRPGKLQWQKASARLPHRTEQSLNTSHLEVVFVNQLRRIVRLIRPLSVVDCEKLGLRNTDDVVEAFVRANTRRKKRKT
ncbi:hypothetical protein D915_009443 [Fasciola hepatica]|uniref:SERRATE/Ars2 N-terminal domain-containing protein n=1 Tax=Fasciola hepatica TaxID=6192 RepID=A0A4E0R041_FASHE|nr:hypothetical protein D915_009443 [Fasciola hepatica]